MERTDVYLRMKKKVTIDPKEKITIRDIVHIHTNTKYKQILEEMPLHFVYETNQHYKVLDAFELVTHLKTIYPFLQFELIGPNETILHMQTESKRPPYILFLLVWIILFVGTAMSIMNFHYDVSMHEVHQKIHFLFTGEHNMQPLWIQIPYSFGLGIGMILFLNQWFTKRINKEPSPLELELFNYEKNINDYISNYENDLNDEKRHL